MCISYICQNIIKEMITGQTMFQYLKRQKRINSSELSTSKSLYTPKQQPIDRDLQKTQRNHQKIIQNINTQRTINMIQQDKNQSKTSRRNFIIQQPNNKMRSFLKLISPIRHKSSNQRQQTKVQTKIVNDKKTKMKDNYTKYMLQQKINTMRQTIQSFIKQGKHLKQKCKFLFIDIQPLLRHVQKCGESCFQRKTQQIKAKIKSIQSILHNFLIQQSQSSINQFYLQYSQHLNELQGNAIAEISQTRSALQSQLLNNNKAQVQQITLQKNRLQRQLSLLLKKYQKSQNRIESLVTQLQKVRNNYIDTDKRKCDNYEVQLNKQINQVNRLKAQNQQLKQSMAICQSQRKQAVFSKQKTQNQCLDAITKVKSQQEQFLLNQIIILKKQFSNDINKLSQLHKIKQLQLIDKNKNLQNQVSRLKDGMQDTLNTNKILQQSIINLKGQNIRLKKHNDCIATDMHRINEELYQHWLALKDIKILSTRLDIFHKFKKIYQDLMFNQTLFL